MGGVAHPAQQLPGRLERLACALQPRSPRSASGIRSDPLGAAGTVAVAGAILAVSAHWSHLTEARTYALLVGAVGLTNIGWGLVRAKPTT